MKDQGIGIPADKLDKIFLEFGKLEDPNKMNMEGTGLGLSIAKSIVLRMNGDVKVQSECDRGTSFVITMRSKIQLQENQSGFIDMLSRGSSNRSSEVDMSLKSIS